MRKQGLNPGFSECLITGREILPVDTEILLSRVAFLLGNSLSFFQPQEKCLISSFLSPNFLYYYLPVKYRKTNVSGKCPSNGEVSKI